MSDAVSRAVRTLAQMLVGGGFAALFTQIVKDVPPQYGVYLSIFFTLLVSFVQNVLEDKGAIPTILGKATEG